jgi:CheY-like chemotaxis protein/anti-sigma regulatory factor (Ser/Thr protein kinase)
LLISPKEPQPLREKAKLSGKRILILEDDLTMHDVIALMLENQDCQMRFLENAKNWEKELYEFKPDVIFSDVMMPGMKGTDVLSDIRKKYPVLPIVLTSGTTPDEIVKACMNNQAAGFLAKPFSQDDLIKTLERSLMYKPNTDRIVFDDVHSDWMDFILSSSPVALELLNKYLESLSHQPIPDEIRADVIYCIKEIAGNAIEWGNLNNPSFKVRISTVLLPDRVMIKISDEGAGFDVVHAMGGDLITLQDEREVYGKREGGFGLAIVKEKMDTFSVNTRGNVIVFTKKY